MDLAAQMPPAVLSHVLGIGIQAATHWADAVGSARTEYAADLSNRRADSCLIEPQPSG